MNFVDAFTEHPILGLADDYPNGTCAASVTLSRVENEIAFDVAMLVNSEVISTLLVSKKASLIVELTCGRTFYRRCFKSFELSFRFYETTASFSGKLEFDVAIVCEEPIQNFNSDEHHVDYKGAIINIDKGDVLAYADRLEHILDPITGDFVNNHSIVGLRSSLMSGKPYAVDLSLDRIIVELPEETIHAFADSSILTSKRLSPLALSAIVQNALLTAIFALSSDDSGQYSDRIWHDVLCERLSSELGGLDSVINSVAPERAAILASQLVRNPILDLPQMIIDLKRNAEEE